MTIHSKITAVVTLAITAPFIGACGGGTVGAEIHSVREVSDALESKKINCSAWESDGLDYEPNDVFVDSFIDGVTDVWCYGLSVLFITDEDKYKESVKALCADGGLDVDPNFKIDLIVGKNFIVGGFIYEREGGLNENYNIPENSYDMHQAFGGKLVEYTNLTEQWC
jgi:hypothetical protein